VDGVLPLLRYFFANLFAPPKSGEDRDWQLRITDRLLTNLLALCDSLTLYFTSEAQVRLYRSTVVTLLKFPTPSMRTSETAHMLANFDQKTKEGKCAASPTREQYMRDYEEEMRLNEEFDRFVANFQLAYEGPNTAHAQTGAKYDTAYSDFLDDSSQPGDEYLPLGPSFQDHVGLFVRQSRGGGLPIALAGGEREEELLRPETARLVTQLEVSFRMLKDLGETERQRQDELDIKNLRILRAIVHNEIMNIDPQLKEDDPTGYRRRCVNKVQPVQNKLQSFGNVVSRVVPLLSHPNDEIVREVLAFLKVMLYSGNRNVQRGFEHLLDTREERLFTTMRGLLQHAAVTYIERRALLGQVASRKATEEALLSGFNAGQRKEDSASLKRVKFQESVTVTVDFSEEADKSGEHFPMSTMGRLSVWESEEVEEDRKALVTSPTPSSKKSAKAARRTRISSKPVLEMFEPSHSPGKEEHTDLDPHAGVPPETMKVLKFQDSAHIKLALQVLGLMCDGQFRLMQNYLREQRDNILTINLVGEVALFAQHFYTDVNQETMDLVHLILQTIIETCVGNFPNQEVIYNRQIIDVLNTILQLNIGDYHNHQDGFKYIENVSPLLSCGAVTTHCCSHSW
jgi:inositol 1,4,5-triphosphate receptor type 1